MSKIRTRGGTSNLVRGEERHSEIQKTGHLGTWGETRRKVLPIRGNNVQRPAGTQMKLPWRLTVIQYSWKRMPHRNTLIEKHKRLTEWSASFNSLWNTSSNLRALWKEGYWGSYMHILSRCENAGCRIRLASSTPQFRLDRWGKMTFLTALPLSTLVFHYLHTSV